MSASVKYLDSDGNTQLTVKNWPNATAGQNQTPRKFTVENSGDRVLGNVSIPIEAITGNDGSSMLRTALDSNGTLTRPYGVAGVLSAPGAGGVWAAAQVYGWKITALNAIGETIGSAEVTVNVNDLTKTVTLTWTTVPGATSYKIYRTATAGTYTSPVFRSSTAATTFVDDGSAVSSGAPPTANTTGGWVLGAVLSGAGQGGVWVGTGTRYWKVTAHDSAGVEIAQTTEISVNVDDVTKRVTLSWAAFAAAANFKVWRSTSQGNYPSPALVATLASGSTAYADTGTATTTGALTTTPSYGLPPAVFGTAALSIGTLAIGQQSFFWVNRVIGVATPEAGNPRVALTSAKET